MLTRHLLVLGANLKLGAHGVGGDRAEVENADWGAGVDWLGAELLVGVTQNTAHRLGVTNLAARVEVVLARQNILWAELTEILRLDHLTGDQAGGRHVTTGILGTMAIHLVHLRTLAHSLVTGTLIAQRGVTNVVATDGGAGGEAAALGSKYQKENDYGQNHDCQSLAIHIINSYR